MAPSAFTDTSGHRYKSNEAFYHAQKYILGAKHAACLDPAAVRAVANQIIQQRGPKKAKLIAHDKEGLLSKEFIEEWNAGLRVDVMMNGLRMKYQRADRRAKLLGTGDAYLAQRSPGCGPFWSIDKNHKGKNMLGVCLMRLREELSMEDMKRKTGQEK
jgi:predicted NAD-dependent protein-ADP-ribosyltransferase YbiA (DUF1768 family)